MKTRKIFLHINDLVTAQQKAFTDFKAMKRYLNRMPGLFPPAVKKPWLELTENHYQALMPEQSLLISLTPAGTSYTVIPTEEIEKTLSA